MATAKEIEVQILHHGGMALSLNRQAWPIAQSTAEELGLDKLTRLRSSNASHFINGKWSECFTAVFRASMVGDADGAPISGRIVKITGL